MTSPLSGDRTMWRISRRSFMQLSAGAATAAMVAACQSAPAAPEAPAEAAPAVPASTDINEAPAFAEQVAAGELPALEERLPAQPMVVTPVEQVGVYGGVWRSGLLGPADRPWLTRTMAYEGLMRWTPDLTATIPNVAESVEVSEDGAEFIFHLREGMKWSDGELFTADDIVFWYEHDILNDELTPLKPIYMRVGGEVGTVEKVDDYTVRFQFAAPHGLFLTQLGGSLYQFTPVHYAEQWHKTFNDQIDDAAQEAGFQDWVAYYRDRTDYMVNEEAPVIFPWRVTVSAKSAERVVGERNPYYWKVDTEGNQLPYIDGVDYQIVDNVEVLVLKALSGEVDMMDRHIATPANKAVFFDNQEAGAYHFFNVQTAWEGPVVIALNLNHKDPVLKEIFNQKNFRVALSHAINRQEIIDVIYVSDGKPAQPAPLPESPYYHEQLESQYLEYDVELANQLLDELGLERGPDGVRLRPDGQPLSFPTEVALAFEPWVEIMELVAGYWRAVGIETQVQGIDRALFYERKTAYEHSCVVWTGADAIAVVIDPRSYFPYSNESNYGIAWADWWQSGGQRGEEPPEAAKQQYALYEELQVTVDAARQAEIVRELLDIAAEQFWAIGITRYYQAYGIIKNNFHNVPETLWQWHVSASPAQTNPEQYYMTPA
jgi:peptide/nickel transport system substrate-binding protein